MVSRLTQLRKVARLAIETQMSHKELQNFENRELVSGRMDIDAVKEDRLYKKIEKSQLTLLDYCKQIKLTESEYFSIDILHMQNDGISFDEFINS